jgi:SH3 domain protein
MKMMISAVFIFVLTGFSSAYAENAYVYDKDKGLWSRKGPSTEFGVAKKYVPGSKLEIVAKTAENGFTQVIDNRGVKSWIPSNYLLPTANIQLDLSLNQIKTLKADHQKAIKKLQAELSARGPLEQINQKLQSNIAAMQIELEQLRQSNDAIGSRFNREVYFAGGATILVGLFFGWLVGLRGRKRNDAWS